MGMVEVIRVEKFGQEWQLAGAENKMQNEK
jgi:hypothetical protein